MTQLNQTFTVTFQFDEMVATVTKVHVNGQALVRNRQIIIELKTDNAIIEIQAPMNGLVKMNDQIKVGVVVKKDDILFTIDQALVPMN